MAESLSAERNRPDDGHDADLFAALADELADGVQGLYLLARSIADGLDDGLPCAVATLTHGGAPDGLYHEAERRARRIPPADRSLIVERALADARIAAAELLGCLAEALALIRCETTVGGPTTGAPVLVEALRQMAAAPSGSHPAAPPAT
jgi:hypothetical protein